MSYINNINVTLNYFNLVFLSCENSHLAFKKRSISIRKRFYRETNIQFGTRKQQWQLLWEKWPSVVSRLYFSTHFVTGKACVVKPVQCRWSIRRFLKLLSSQIVISYNRFYSCYFCLSPILQVVLWVLHVFYSIYFVLWFVRTPRNRIIDWGNISRLTDWVVLIYFLDDRWSALIYSELTTILHVLDVQILMFPFIYLETCGFQFILLFNL